MAMAKHRRRPRKLVFYHDGRPQTMARQEALQKSLLLIQEWPDFEVVAVESTETTDRITLRQHSSGEVVRVTAYFEAPDPKGARG
jgi:hypothetical protein